MATLRVDNVGAAGFLPDQEFWRLDVNAWTTLQDARVRDSSIYPPQFFRSKFAGQVTLDTAFIDVFIHENVGATWYILCSATKVWASRSTQLIDITPTDKKFLADFTKRWQATYLNGILILNNGNDEPYYWPLETPVGEEAPKLAPLSSYPGESPWEPGQTCEFMVAFRSALFAGNIRNAFGAFPYLVKFSDFAEPGTLPQKWAAAPDNSAGQRDLAEGTDEIVGAMVFKDTLFVRKRNSVYKFTFTGGQFVYTRRQQTDQISCLNKHCIINTDNFQVVVADNDIYATQGTGHDSFVKDRTKEWFFDNLNRAALEKVFCVHDSINSEIWIMAPHGTSEFVNVALIWNYVENTFVTRTCEGFVSGSEGYGVSVEDFISWADLAPDTWAEWEGPWGTENIASNQKRLFFTRIEEVNAELDEWNREVFLAVDDRTQAVEEVDEILLERMHIPFPRGDIMDWETIKQVSFITPKCRKASPEFYIDLWLGMQDDIDSPLRWYGPKRWYPGKKKVAFDKPGRFVSLRARMPIGIDFRLTGYDIEYKLVSKR